MAMTTTNKIFTIAEARKTLPYVKLIANDIMSTWQEIIIKRKLMEEKDKAKLDTTNEKTELNLLIDKINGYIKEVEDLGCFAQEFRRGIIVWPSLRNGEKIFLCWSVGEDNIMYWHRLDETFKDKQALSGMMLQ